MLDPKPWAVVSYDAATGDCVLERGAIPVELGDVDGESKALGFEGNKRALFIIHRKREARLRKAEIEEALKRNKGHLPCEVPGCGYGFLSSATGKSAKVLRMSTTKSHSVSRRIKDAKCLLKSWLSFVRIATQ